MPSSRATSVYRKRVGKLQRQLAREKIDGLLVTDLTNVRYLTGFVSSAAKLIVSEEGCVLITDSRYIEAARTNVTFAEVYRTTKDAKNDLRSLLKKYNVRRLGFESSNVSYSQYRRLKGYMSERRLRPRTDMVERLRMIKDAGEIRAIRRAIRLAEKSFRHIRRLLKSGVREKYIGVKLELFARANGADKLAFDPIIAFGRGSAIPHYHTGGKKLCGRNMVLVDWGVTVGGYSSDLTRTLLSHSMTDREKAIYAVVLEAQHKAIEKIRPGVSLGLIDRTARDHISKYGYGDAFSHSLGHGIGLNVHEIPVVSSKSKMRCRKGMVMTVEPGIYIPGWGGVRIEDDILVTGKGCEVLSRLTRKARTF
jgi:Xaa-Pro aminopeptidase